MTTTGKVTLAKLVAATLVTATTVLLVVLGVVSWRSEAKHEREALEGLATMQADGLAVALAVPVWNIDRPVIGKILDAMARPKSIWGVCIVAGDDAIGRRRNAQWKLVPWDGVGPPRDLLVQERPIFYQNNRIGVVDLYVTYAGVEKDLRTLRNQLITTIVAIDLLIIVSVYLVLWRSVLRPITEIQRYAGAVSAGSERQSAPAIAGSAAELESLRSSIESMVNLLVLREERFRSIFESANDAIFIVDAQTGVVLDVNARLQDMFGYSREESARIDPSALSSGVPPYSRGNFLALIRGLKPGDRRIFEWRARHKDGHTFWVEVSLRAATIGGVMRIVSVVRDVEERKAMEEKLRRSETMSAMGNLVAGVAHEVRNPLFGIAATLDAFEAEHGGGEGMDEYMSTLRHDVARLSRLMHDLLDYAHPEEPGRRAQSIRPVIAEAVRVCSPRAKEKRIEIREEIAPELPDVVIDADRMLQVLKNVVENALEFSKAGEAVTLRVRNDDNGAASVLFTIADHGPGFREEDLPHVFEPFFTRRPGGTGLGLAIVQKIVGDHGGTIAARNAKEGGGVVEIRLPVAADPH